MSEVGFAPAPQDGWADSAFTHATHDDRLLTVSTAARTWQLPRRWLRDNCRCAECRIEQTSERRFLPLGTALGASIDDAAIVGGTLHVDWSDGHRSTWTTDDLRMIEAESRHGWTPVHWDDAFTLPRFDHDTVLGDPARLVEALTRFRDVGVILVTGVPCQPGYVEQFLGALGVPLREMPFDRVHDVRVDPSGYNVSHTDEAVPPHTDFPSYQWPPSGQLLHMLHNDAGGGESIVVDGWSVLADLRRDHPELFDVLTRTEVPFRQYDATHETFARSPIVRLDPAGEVCGIRFSNQLMQALPHDHPELEAFYDAYLVLLARVTDPANQCRRRLEAGEMLMVHGHRVLHARDAFTGGPGDRHLQDTYFEFDDVTARIHQLAEAIGAGNP